MMAEHPDMRIEVQGHTDNRGSESYNKRLSEERAKAVVDYLVRKGVSPKRMEFKGYGSSQPIDDNETDEGRAQNRRVAFKILDL